MRYEISSRESGHVMGVYEAQDRDGAVRAMWRDAGYATDADAADALGMSVIDALCDVRVEEAE